MHKIGGIDCYVSTPTGEYPTDKVVLFLTDVFGIPLINNRLLNDDFARNGFRTVMPDLSHGDARTDLGDPSFDRQKWVAAHGPETWKPVVDAVVEGLKVEGVTRIGTTSYCYGAPPALYLASKNEVHVTTLTHPSRLVIPDDFEKYRAVAKAPIFINSCEVDPAFPAESQAVADELFGNGAFVQGYERAHWVGCTHGFAVRGDMSNPQVKAGKEGAFLATVKFLKRYM